MNGPWPAKQIATDVEAYLRTQALRYAIEPYPIHVMRWGLASTKNSHHFWHIDSDGFASYISLECGVKVFFLGTPKDFGSNFSYANFHDGNLFTTNFEPNLVNTDLWDLEYVVLNHDVDL